MSCLQGSLLPVFFAPRFDCLYFHTYVMLRCWTFSCTRLHEILEVLVCCSLAQKRDRQCPQQTQTTLYLNQKKRTFSRSSWYTELQFRCGKTLDFPLLRRPFHGIWTTNLLKKNQNVQITTVSDTSTTIMSLSDVVTDTAPYRRWNLCFSLSIISPLWLDMCTLGTEHLQMLLPEALTALPVKLPSTPRAYWYPPQIWKAPQVGLETELLLPWSWLDHGTMACSKSSKSVIWPALFGFVLCHSTPGAHVDFEAVVQQKPGLQTVSNSDSRTNCWIGAFWAFGDRV
jgi:hypothetical protein